MIFLECIGSNPCLSAMKSVKLLLNGFFLYITHIGIVMSNIQ